MDLRNRIKQLLRMCGQAFVTTVHDDLKGIDSQLKDILEQNAEMARTQTALLQSGVHLVESLPRLFSDIQQFESRLTAQINDQNAKNAQLQAIVENELKNFAAKTEQARVALTQSIELIKQQFENGIKDLAARTEQAYAALMQSANDTQNFLANETVRQVCLETSDYVATNPEVGLMASLYSHLPTRKALDIGAHVGQVSENLLKAGYEVYAFEPYMPSYKCLIDRLKSHSDFKAFNLALGDADGDLPLHLVQDLSADKRYGDPSVFHSLALHDMPDDLSFQGTVPVQVRKLAELHRDGTIPKDISLVKIDTEGYDLEVIRGMKAHRYAVISVEFWEKSIPFAKKGLLYTAQTVIQELQQRGYSWYIVLYRVWGQDQTAFYCNHDRPVPNTWGNVFFFQEYETFAQAQQWCSAVLPRTHFKPVPA